MALFDTEENAVLVRKIKGFIDNRVAALAEIVAVDALLADEAAMIALMTDRYTAQKTQIQARITGLTNSIIGVNTLAQASDIMTVDEKAEFTAKKNANTI